MCFFQIVFCTKYPAITTNSRKVVNALLYLSAIYILHSECHGATHLSPSRKFLLHFFCFVFIGFLIKNSHIICKEKKWHIHWIVLMWKNLVNLQNYNILSNYFDRYKFLSNWKAVSHLSIKNQGYVQYFLIGVYNILWCTKMVSYYLQWQPGRKQKVLYANKHIA